MGKFIPPSPRPLVPQHPPVGVFREYVMPHPTTLVLQEKVLDWSGDGFRIMDSNGAVVAKCKGKSFSMHDRTIWTAPDGRPLFNLVKKLISFHAKYNAEDESGNVLFGFANKFAIGSKMVCTFKNAFDGRELELKLRGDTWGKNAEICLNDMPIAFINHQIMNAREWFTGQDSYLVTIAPGVDIALIAAFCVTFDNIENEKDKS